ncbi:hypothetical protein [Streptomyces sp. NPDC059994]
MSIGTFAVDGGDTVLGELRTYGENPSAFLVVSEEMSTSPWRADTE